VIRVQGLTKHYGSTTAVDGLTFTVEPGRITGFLGPNGAGKSTTMRLILGLDRADAGVALVDGQPYWSLFSPICTLGALLETRSMHPGRSGYNHLLWIAQTHGISTARIKRVLELVELSNVADRRVGTYSLGMTQRLGLAAALLGNPNTIMLDEPMNGLDPAGMVWIRDMLRTLANEGRAVFVSSHLMSEMQNLADQLIVIDQGRLVADTTPQELIADHDSLEAAFLNLTRKDIAFQGEIR
jgi:ABC-2 type transport system ATP-binding protein